MPDPPTTDRPRPGPVGIVGAGQLARMTCEAASALGIDVVVLAEHEDDAAVAVAPAVLIGSPRQPDALRALAQRCAVMTFDHEQIDVDLVAEIERAGTPVRPGAGTLRMAVDKAVMRQRLGAAGLPVPRHAALTAADTALPAGSIADVLAAVDAFAATTGWPVVLKAARGGYDGKGVWPVDDLAAAGRVCAGAAEAGVPLLVEEQVPLDVELAVLVVRRPGGEAATWPAVQTVQVDGVCREVLLPGALGAALARRAEALGRAVADVAGSTGVLAVELFLAGDELLVNEVAARPHNSGHWTIEGATTSQFENHLRAVLDLPLGATDPTASRVASVNVFGPPDGSAPADRLAEALAVDAAHVHLYGKQARPGRKLGHVTVCGDDLSSARARAWAAARALGSPVPAGIGMGA